MPKEFQQVIYFSHFNKKILYCVYGGFYYLNLNNHIYSIIYIMLLASALQCDLKYLSMNNLLTQWSALCHLYLNIIHFSAISPAFPDLVTP